MAGGLDTALLGLSLAAALALSQVQARILEPIGPVRPLAEPDLLEQIQQRLAEKARSGELAALQQQASQATLAALRTPAPVAGLVTDSKAHTSYVDPSYVLERDIVDAGGQILFGRGMRVNPLDALAMPGQLLFFDARDARQLKLAATLLAHNDHPIKPVLVGGSPMELSRLWRRPVYFDQTGALAKKLHIVQVPAMVTQDGKRLRIDAYGVQP
ncbi:type-F conjugative transfer system protein TraW [Rugamonas sp. FT29W]|uniref:Type-F conjugative transfer system protein TraW n=2 Tax=Rugamonas aquatica TaxID=2743357 RepID=A0A6A7N6P5_9BURK|nr:type-F conjugative transfer system protein TraW [Rugamonas aquatica]